MDSATRKAIHGDEFVVWTKVVDQLSQILYTLQWANYQRAEGKGTEPQIQQPPKPWDQDPWPFDDEED